MSRELSKDFATKSGGSMQTNDSHATCANCGKRIHSTINRSYWFHCDTMNVTCEPTLQALPLADSIYGDGKDGLAQ